jgi:hypothetical protein
LVDSGEYFGICIQQDTPRLTAGSYPWTQQRPVFARPEGRGAKTKPGFAYSAVRTGFQKRDATSRAPFAIYSNCKSTVSSIRRGFVPPKHFLAQRLQETRQFLPAHASTTSGNTVGKGSDRGAKRSALQQI